MEVFREGVAWVLNQWPAHRYACEHQLWLSGPPSHVRAKQIPTAVLSWFSQSKELLYIWDLESVLFKGLLSLKVEVLDGSVLEVAAILIDMHEKCLNGTFKSVEDIKKDVLARIVNDDENDDNDEDGDRDENILGDDNSANMDVVIPISESNMNSVNRPASGPLPVDPGSGSS